MEWESAAVLSMDRARSEERWGRETAENSEVAGTSATRGACTDASSCVLLRDCGGRVSEERRDKLSETRARKAKTGGDGGTDEEDGLLRSGELL